MKKLLLTSMIASAAIAVQAQAPAIQWEKTLGGTGTDIASCIRQTSDGGYIVAGETTSNDGDVSGNNGANDTWVAKLDAQGALVWQNALGGSGDDRAAAVAPTSDGGYIVAGTSNSSNGDVSGGKGNYDFWVVKLTAAGAMSWQKMLGGTGIDEAKSIEQTADGGYIVAGFVRSNNLDVTVNNGNSDYWVVKLDATGTITWQKSLGGANDDIAYSVKQTTDGGYIVAGESSSTNGDVTGNNGSTDYWVVKLTSTGTITWQKAYGGTAIDKAKSVYQTSEGGYIIGGTAASTNGNITTNNGLENPWIVKVSATGTIEWQKCYGGTFYDAANSIMQTNDGGYIFAGIAASNSIDVSGNHGGDDIWAVKINNSGILQWQKCLGGTSSDNGFSVQQTADNGYIIAGKSSSSNGDKTVAKGLQDFWTVKLVGVPTNTNNPSTGINDVNGDDNIITAYPNPFNGQITIHANEHPALANGFQATIFNALGEQIYTSGVQQKEIVVNLDNTTTKGIYFLSVTTDKNEVVATRKVILE